MQDFLLNIDNKEILIEILHHSIDYLIGNHSTDSSLLKLCHKYGFQSSEDFLLTIKAIAKSYKNHCIDSSSEAELLTDFANMNPDLQQMVPKVLAIRKPEISKFLVREHMAREHPLVESFDWDVRHIMGDSSFAQNRRQLVTVTLNCLQSTGKRDMLHFQMNQQKLDEFIEVLQKAVNSIDSKNTTSAGFDVGDKKLECKKE